jgi:hypothetical protein
VDGDVADDPAAAVKKFLREMIEYKDAVVHLEVTSSGLPV